MPNVQKRKRRVNPAALSDESILPAKVNRSEKCHNQM
jgi:hypothetical protein